MRFSRIYIFIIINITVNAFTSKEFRFKLHRRFEEIECVGDCGAQIIRTDHDMNLFEDCIDGMSMACLKSCLIDENYIAGLILGTIMASFSCDKISVEVPDENAAEILKILKPYDQYDQLRYSPASEQCNRTTEYAKRIGEFMPSCSGFIEKEIKKSLSELPQPCEQKRRPIF